MAAALTRRAAKRKMGFALTWWSFTFPVGTCVTGTSQLAVHTDLVMFRWAAVLCTGVCCWPGSRSECVRCGNRWMAICSHPSRKFAGGGTERLRRAGAESRHWLNLDLRHGHFAPSGSGRRLRRAVRTTDRASGPRGASVLRSGSAHAHRRTDPGQAATGHHPSGGPSSVYVDDAPAFDEAILHAEVPVFGICYGFQVMAAALGGQVDQTGLRVRADCCADHRVGVVRRTARRAVGVDVARRRRGAGAGRLRCRRDHRRAPVAAFVHQSRPLAGVQFHPEVAHTDYGQAILQRFLYDVAGLTANWSTEGVIDAEVSAVSQQIGAGRAICGLSGGVDSAVAAALVQRAIGDRLTCVFVDHGLLRRGEVEQVERDFVAATGARLVVVDARKAVPRRPGTGNRPRAEAQDHRPGVHPGLRGRGQRGGRRGGW